jgi:hypothetical protein
MVGRPLIRLNAERYAREADLLNESNAQSGPNCAGERIRLKRQQWRLVQGWRKHDFEVVFGM